VTGTNDLLTWKFNDRMPIPQALKRTVPSQAKALLVVELTEPDDRQTNRSTFGS